MCRANNATVTARQYRAKLHHHRPQTVKQDGRQDRRQAGLGDKPRRRTQHPRHMETNGREVGTQDRRQEKDKTREGDTASQTKDKLGALVKLPI